LVYTPIERIRMQLRVLKRIPLGEVDRRVTELEEKYEGSLENIPEQFAERTVDRQVFEDYVEWMGMVHALRAYGEGEDFDYLTEEIMDLGDEEISRLTPRRIELLDKISRSQVSSINDLAKQIGRDVKNVYVDLKTLEGMGFLRLVREGRNVVPELLVHEITILLW